MEMKLRPYAKVDTYLLCIGYKQQASIAMSVMYKAIEACFNNFRATQIDC